VSAKVQMIVASSQSAPVAPRRRVRPTTARSFAQGCYGAVPVAHSAGSMIGKSLLDPLLWCPMNGLLSSRKVSRSSLLWMEVRYLHL
jgi:hypothetical protein